MISPTLESFKRKINSGNLIPVFKNIDIDNTISSYGIKLHRHNPEIAQELNKVSKKKIKNLTFEKDRGEDIYGNNSLLKKLGKKNFR